MNMLPGDEVSTACVSGRIDPSTCALNA
jgi:hypothetical protein